jgi:hypothetical protein
MVRASLKELSNFMIPEKKYKRFDTEEIEEVRGWKLKKPRISFYSRTKGSNSNYNRKKF